MGRRKVNSDVICIPIVETIEVKAGRTLFPIDYEKRYGKENVRYDYYPALDENGNEITKCDIYYTTDKVTFRFIKRKTENKTRKLFNTHSDLHPNEKEEEEKEKSLSPTLTERT